MGRGRGFRALFTLTVGLQPMGRGREKSFSNLTAMLRGFHQCQLMLSVLPKILETSIIGHRYEGLQALLLSEEQDRIEFLSGPSPGTNAAALTCSLLRRNAQRLNSRCNHPLTLIFQKITNLWNTSLYIGPILAKYLQIQPKQRIVCPQTASMKHVNAPPKTE